MLADVRDFAPKAQIAGIALRWLAPAPKVGLASLRALWQALKEHRPDVLVPLTAVPNIWGRVFAKMQGLAPVIVHEIEKILYEIKALGITTVIVEQNAVAALKLADRAGILDTGEVAYAGTAKSVLDNAELRQEYLAI